MFLKIMTVMLEAFLVILFVMLVGALVFMAIAIFAVLIEDLKDVFPNWFKRWRRRK